MLEILLQPCRVSRGEKRKSIEQLEYFILHLYFTNAPWDRKYHHNIRYAIEKELSLKLVTKEAPTRTSYSVLSLQRIALGASKSPEHSAARTLNATALLYFNE